MNFYAPKPKVSQDKIDLIKDLMRKGMDALTQAAYKEEDRLMCAALKNRGEC